MCQKSITIFQFSHKLAVVSCDTVLLFLTGKKPQSHKSNCCLCSATLWGLHETLGVDIVVCKGYSRQRLTENQASTVCFLHLEKMQNIPLCIILIILILVYF